MKTFFINLIISFLCGNISFSQNITADTTLANEYYKIADNFRKAYELDSALLYLEKAQPLYIKHLGEISLKNANVLHLLALVYEVFLMYDKSLEYFFKSLEIRLELLGEKNVEVARSYNNIGNVYLEKLEYDKALEYHFKSLEVRLELLGENHKDVAKSYNNIAAIYYGKSEYDKSLEYYFKSLEIRLELFSEKNVDIAKSYSSIGNVYCQKSEYDKALEYYFKSLKIRLEILGEKHIDVAKSYNNIGTVYFSKSEYDKALEYFFKSLEIRLELLGEKHIDVAIFQMNIGLVYCEKSEYDKALEYYFKSLEIRLELLGEKHIDVAMAYMNIGTVYFRKSEYDKALEYYFKSLEIRLEVLGGKHTFVAGTYNNIGLVYYKKLEYDKALEYYFKSLEINVEVLGEKHDIVATTYNNIGNVFFDKKEYDNALAFFQKGITSCLWNFNDTTNVYSVPVIEDYLNWDWLLENIRVKAQILADTSKTLTKYGNLSTQERLNLALRHYQACDTLLGMVRREISTQSDKLALGERANKVYNEAINVCYRLNNKELAFYFSERNKSSVLLEALAGQEAQRFAGIPDSLLQQENDWKTEITLLKQKLVQVGALDSLQTIESRSRLFYLNRSYDSLIYVFETQYPEYFTLKYSTKNATIADIQRLLDKKTAMISYSVGDTTITVFTISNKSVDMQQIALTVNFAADITLFRNALTLPNSSRFNQYFKTMAYDFYELLFPKNLEIEIENLIIIPDAYLSSIPFETFLYQKVDNNTPFHLLPYLVQKYNISYSYSATLFQKTFPKENTENVEVTSLEDWLAFAPVADENAAGMSLATRVLSEKMTSPEDTLQTRNMHSIFSALPGTRTEVNNILELYDSKNMAAQIHINQSANESFIKSGILEKYSVIHFATHGLVNSSKPELSCILLAKEDSTSTEDGILFSGEIYNLKINADLVVLSACETGLGEIKKGEGIIGLTRALLYAGTRNIVVSLWKVSDNSTAKLMIDFYQNIVNQSDNNYAKSLSKAKQNMIQCEEFAHPFYWSPFILVGK